MNARSGLLSAALVMLVLSIAMPRAQRAAAPNPVIPVAANTVAANPDAYYGDIVTVTAAVQKMFSPKAFAVAQKTIPGVANAAAMTREVLVLAPYLQSPLPPDTYFTVVGEVVRFDPATIATKLKGPKVDITEEMVAKYQGRPVIVATAVIDGSRVNLAKRLPPPLSAEETAYAARMKRIAPAFAALRTALDASNAEATKEHLAVLGPAFAETAAFWKARADADAAKWSEDGQKQIAAIENGLAAANWADMKTQAGTLGQSCQSCHAARRERFDDGSFRIMAEAK